MAVIVGLLVALFAGYLYLYRPAVADDWRRLALLSFLIAATSLAAKLTVFGGALDTYYAYLLPAAAASMLVAVLLDGELALAVTALLAVVMGLAGSTSFGDLKQIRSTFALVLQGIYHPRIEYPTQQLPLLGAENGSEDRVAPAGPDSLPESKYGGRRAT